MAAKRKWSQDDMEQAYQEYKSDSLSIYAVAKKYDIPHMTLSGCVLGKVPLEGAHGHPIELTLTEELSLQNYIIYMQERHILITREQVILLVRAVDLKRPEDLSLWGKWTLFDMGAWIQRPAPRIDLEDGRTRG